jgi:hypothetical protein
MSTTQAMALEKLSLAVDMNIFQELLDLDSPSELFSKDIVNEFLILAPEALSTMDESLYVSFSFPPQNQNYIFSMKILKLIYSLETKKVTTSISLNWENPHNRFAAHQWCLD